MRPKASERGSTSGSGIGCLGVVILFGLLVWLALPGTWTDKIIYSMEYSVSMGHVHEDKKPADCDWTYAPLGNKGCHYTKVVSAYNSEDQQVAGEGAPNYSHDVQTGKPIISYDGRKTWQFLPEGTTVPDLTVSEVQIEWTKEQE